MKGFDLILGYDYLRFYHALHDCHYMGVLFCPLGKPKFFFPCRWGGTKKVLVSTHRSRSLMRKGYSSFHVSVSEVQEELKPLSKIDVVWEYPNVFLEDLPGFPPDHSMEFSIDLMPRTTPISKAPYHMAHAKLVKFKKQLEELLDKGCIRWVLYPRNHFPCSFRRRMVQCACALTIAWSFKLLWRIDILFPTSMTYLISWRLQ